MSKRTQRRRFVRPTTSGRRRAALVSTAQSGTAVVACTLWVALALPGLHLLPGLGNDGDAGVAISLQSALLGIDDQGSQPANASLRASLRALGIDAHGSLSAALSRTRSEAAFAPLVALVDAPAQTAVDVSATPAPPAPPNVAELVARVRRPAPPQAAPHVPVHAPVPPVRPPVTTPPVTAPPATPPPASPQGQTIIFTSTPPASATSAGRPTPSPQLRARASRSSSAPIRRARACAPSPAASSPPSASARARSMPISPGTRATSRRRGCSSRSRSGAVWRRSACSRSRSRRCRRLLRSSAARRMCLLRLRAPVFLSRTPRRPAAPARAR